MELPPQPASTRAPKRERTQPGRLASKSQGNAFDQMFGASPYFAFIISEAGRLLACNAHTQGLLGPFSDEAPAAQLYAGWVLPMLQNEALPTARMRGH